MNKSTCTLCKACIGACPESALQDATESPALRFIERNCVQCGLCAETCPEDAIQLVPRLLLGAAGQGAGDAERGGALPLRALRKALRHAQMVENMLGKLGGHSMFAGGAAPAPPADVR